MSVVLVGAGQRGSRRDACPRRCRIAATPTARTGNDSRVDISLPSLQLEPALEQPALKAELVLGICRRRHRRAAPRVELRANDLAVDSFGGRFGTGTASMTKSHRRRIQRSTAAPPAQWPCNREDTGESPDTLSG